MPRRVFLGMAIQMWSQLSGMNVMMQVTILNDYREVLTLHRYYILYVFRGAGLTGSRVNLIASVRFSTFRRHENSQPGIN